MQLPYIAVEGIGKTREEILQSLIETEMVLWMLGYRKPDENWNNLAITVFDVRYIICVDDEKSILYSNNNSSKYDNQFKSTELMSLINYVEQFKNK